MVKSLIQILSNLVLGQRLHAAQPERAPEPPPVIFNMTRQSYWGNRVQWFEFPDRLVGWLDTRLHPEFREGSCIACDMESGRTAIFQLQKIEWQRNPPDMFFADVTFIEYED